MLKVFWPHCSNLEEVKLDKESLLRGLFMVDWADGFDKHIDDLTDAELDRFAESYYTFSQATVHNGDCVKAPATCIVCMMDDYKKQADRVMAAFERCKK